MAADLVSSEGVRADGRLVHELRDFDCALGVCPQADGSARVRMGDTLVLCSVYGPHECKMRSKRDEQYAHVNCQYSQAVFSTTERKNRPRGDRKSMEAREQLTSTFTAVIRRELYPRAQIDIFVEVLSADGGVLAACVNATSAALVNASIACSGIVAAACCTLVPQPRDDQQPYVTAVDTQHQEERSTNHARVTAAVVGRTRRLALVELEERVHHTHLQRLLDDAVDACLLVHDRLADALHAHTKHIAFRSLKLVRM